MRGDAGDVDLKDRLLLGLLGHGQRGQQRREHGDGQHEDSRAIKLFRGEAGVEPEADGGLHGRGLGAVGELPVVRRDDEAGVSGDQFGGIRVGGVQHELDGRLDAARQVAAKVGRDDQHGPRGVRGEGLLGGFFDGPGDDVEGDGGAEGIDEVVGG